MFGITYAFLYLILLGLGDLDGRAGRQRGGLVSVDTGPDLPAPLGPEKRIQDRGGRLREIDSPYLS